MPQYRIYHLDGTGRVSAAEWLDAAGDDAAVRAARAGKTSVQCELWQGRRLVKRLANGARIAPRPVPPSESLNAATR